MKYLLIVIVHASFSSTINPIEFETLEKCESAKKQITAVYQTIYKNLRPVDIICVQR